MKQNDRIERKKGKHIVIIEDFNLSLSTIDRMTRQKIIKGIEKLNNIINYSI